MTGIVPRSLEASLAAEPATVQEKWFANLFLLKPVVLGVLAFFWIATAFMSLGPGWEIGIGLMHEGGVDGMAAPLTVIAGAFADLCIGMGIAIRRTARPALYAALAVSIGYAVIGTILVPRLWIDPLGHMLKIWAVLALNMVALAILEDR
jgi:DoxX-like family